MQGGVEGGSSSSKLRGLDGGGRKMSFLLQQQQELLLLFAPAAGAERWPRGTGDHSVHCELRDEKRDEKRDGGRVQLGPGVVGGRERAERREMQGARWDGIRRWRDEMLSD